MSNRPTAGLRTYACCPDFLAQTFMTTTSLKCPIATQANGFEAVAAQDRETHFIPGSWRLVLPLLFNTVFRRQPMLLMLLVAGCLGECGATWHPYKAGDTACLDGQVFDYYQPLDRALAACGTSVPNLTGDRNLQQVALNAGVPFRVDLPLDQTLKAADHSRISSDVAFVPTMSVYGSPLLK